MRAFKIALWGLRTAVFGAAPSRTHMPIAENSVFRKWARRSLFVLAILAAPAAYSEVAATVTDRPEPGTLLGNYLAGRVARGLDRA